MNDVAVGQDETVRRKYKSRSAATLTRQISSPDLSGFLLDLDLYNRRADPLCCRHHRPRKNVQPAQRNRELNEETAMKSQKASQEAAAPSPKGKVKIANLKLHKETVQNLSDTVAGAVKGGGYTGDYCPKSSV